MAARRFTPDQHERMAEMREAGATFPAIARTFGCSTSTVSWICLKLGAEAPVQTPLRPYGRGPAITLRNGFPVRRFTPEEDARILALEAAGMSVTAIAREMGRRFNSTTARLRTLARREAREEAA